MAGEEFSINFTEDNQQLSRQMESIARDTQYELESLLAESPADAANRASRELAWFDLQRDTLVLYGAGTLGRAVLAKLRHAGIGPFAFADDTPEKQGELIDGLRVMSAKTAIESSKKRVVFVVTILNPLLRFVDARSRLRELTDTPVLSFLNLAWKYPESFLPYCQFELPQNLLAKASEIRETFRLFGDEESQRQFVAHLRFRLYLDYEALPQNSHDDYFPPDLIPHLPDDTVFVDCGAYDGDSIRQFLRHQDRRFGAIYAFEPDDVNCQRLRDYVTGLGEDLLKRVFVYQAGVGDRRKQVSFNATGNMSASFAAGGMVQVEVLPLQEIVQSDGSPVFVKFDVEGAELEALEGAENLLRQAKPLLAISIYHRPDDLWQLPLYVHNLNSDYRLFLRTQGEDGMDVICYAFPPQIQPK
jgi:FkbM family methyltransferase